MDNILLYNSGFRTDSNTQLHKFFLIYQWSVNNLSANVQSLLHLPTSRFPEIAYQNAIRTVKILSKARTFFSAHNTHIFLRVENQFHYISITYYLFAGKLVGSYQLLKYFSWKVTRQDFPDYYFQLSKQKKH